MRVSGALGTPSIVSAGLVLLVGLVATIMVASALGGGHQGTPKGDTLRGSAAADKLGPRRQALTSQVA